MPEKIALEWLKAANDDLTVIKEIKNNENITHISAFHAQQSIEKSFKALMEYNDWKVPKKHDLIILYKKIQMLIKLDNLDLLDSLNSLYIDARYPGDLGLLPDGKPDLKDTEEFYNFAKDIYGRVKKLVSS